MSVHFQLETRTDLPAETLFQRSLSINEHVSSMANSNERVISTVKSDSLGPGDTVTWQARHFGVVFAMTSQITAFDRPRSFVDQQVKGPFAAFRHEHTFSCNDGKTTMVDDITFTAPFGPLGTLVERLVLGRYLKELIRERNKYLCRPTDSQDAANPS